MEEIEFTEQEAQLLYFLKGDIFLCSDLHGWTKEEIEKQSALLSALYIAGYVSRTKRKSGESFSLTPFGEMKLHRLKERLWGKKWAALFNS